MNKSIYLIHVGLSVNHKHVYKMSKLGLSCQALLTEPYLCICGQQASWASV